MAAGASADSVPATGSPDPSVGASAREPAIDRTVQAVLDAAGGLQATAKWIVAAFAAVGAALIAGISLADLGDLSGSDQTWAIAGAAVGVIGILGVIVMGTRVLASRFVVLHDFDGVTGVKRRPFWDNLRPAPKHEREYTWVVGRIENSPELRSYEKDVGNLLESAEHWQTQRTRARQTIQRLQEEYEKAATTLDEASKNVARQVRGEPTYDQEPARLERQAEVAAKSALATYAQLLRDQQHKLEVARTEVDDAAPVAESLRATAQYEYIKQRFDTSRFWIVFSAAWAAVGAIAFSLAAGTAAVDPAPAVGAFPVRVAVDVNEAGQASLGLVLGEKCELDRFEAIATARTDGGVSIIPISDGCRTIPVVIHDDQGQVTSLSDSLGDRQPRA